MKKLICTLLALLALLMTVSCETETDDSTAFAAFTVNGVTVALDAEAASILAAMGTPRASAETGSCYGDGKDKVYEYTSFKVQTYSSKGVDYILSVEIFDDADASIATPEGIRIGSSAEDVTAKLGEPKAKSDVSIEYLNPTAKTKLLFQLRDGTVTNIQYLKSE